MLCGGVVEVALLAIALSMDAMAVAAAAAAGGLDRRVGMHLALVFGTFHLVMASLGCGLGELAERWMSAWDHWVIFGVLSVLGAKMLVTAFSETPPIESHPDEPRKHGWTVLLALGFVTSIDAIAAGVTLPLLAPPWPFSVTLIALFAGILTWLGFGAGAHLGSRSKYLQIAGALALIGIGTRTLISHLTS
jgi:putative Mn2+ efflux pump MntP